MADNCEHCKYSRARADVQGRQYLFCHRHAPQVLYSEEFKFAGHFPPVDLSTWCGEFEQRNDHVALQTHPFGVKVTEH